jgi:dihydroneopterin aldolase
MSFVTKVDYSSNRQIKQFQFTSTQLSGTTVFGVDDVWIPLNFTGDTINIDALQYIRTRGLIFQDSIPEFTGTTYQILGRDNDTGKVVSISGATGTTISTDSNDYVTGATFTTANGLLEFTRLSGGTFNVDLDGRYAYASGHTHVIADITDFVPTDDYVTGSTFNTANGILQFIRLSGGTFDVDIDGRYLPTSGYTAPTGLEVLNEGNGNGWRLIGRDPNYYGNVGLNAIDFGINNVTGSTFGATGTNSFNVGEDNTLSGYGSVGFGALINSSAITDFNAGLNLVNRGYTNSLFGVGHSAQTMNVTVVGQAAEGIIEQILDFNATTSKALFVVGNGTIANADPTFTVLTRSNAFVVRMNGEITAPSTSIADVDSAGPKSIVTKEYLTGFTQDITTGDTSNWDSAYGDTITGMTVTGSATKTITLLQRDGGTVFASFTDNTGGVGGSGDVVTGMTFNTGNGILTLSTLSGDTITEDLDGRFLHISASTVNSNDYVTGSTFNTTNGLLEFTRLSGGTFSVDLDNRYSLTGHTHTLSDITDYVIVDDYVTGSTFTNGILEFTRQSGSTFNVDLDGRYLTGFTETPNTDDFVTGSTFNAATGDLEFTRQSGTTFNVNLDDRYSLTGHTHATDNTDDYVTGHTFNTTTGLFESTLQSGGTVSVNLDGRYSLTGHTHTSDNTDDYLTGGTFNITTGELDLVLQSGNTITIALDGRYLTGYTETSNTDDYVTGHTFNTSNGLLTSTRLSGGTFNVDLDGRYLNVTASTANSDDFVTGHTFNTTTGLFESTTQSGTTFNVNLDGRYLNVTASTANSNDYVTGSTFNTTNGLLESVRLSGGTFNVDLDGRYAFSSGHTHVIADITDYVPTDDYTTGSTFTTNNGNLEFTRQSGTTFNVNLDGRYLNVTASTTNTDDYLTGGTFNIGTGDLEQLTLIIDIVLQVIHMLIQILMISYLLIHLIQPMVY